MFKTSASFGIAAPEFVHYFAKGKGRIIASEEFVKRIEMPAAKTIRKTPGISNPLWLAQLSSELDAFLEKGKELSRNFEGRIDWSIFSEFQRSVLAATYRIRSGTTKTYGELAFLIGKPKASRAVGTALARNPLPLLIGCHRVVPAGKRSFGSFSMGSGTPLKKQLIELERR